MSRFKWYRRLRGGYWVFGMQQRANNYKYPPKWQSVTESRYANFSLCAALYGGLDNREDWTK